MQARPYFLDELSVAADGAAAALVRSVPLPARNGNMSCTGTLSGPSNEGGGTLSFDG